MNTYSNLSAYPFPIIRAFTEVQIDYEGMEKDSGPEEVIKYFVSRWGGLDLDTFVHVLEVGQQDEKLLAIFVLGYTGLPQFQEVLVSLLRSPIQVERWASACLLGMMRDERALPHLQELLVIALPHKKLGIPVHLLSMWYPIYRRKIAYLFGEWGPALVVSILRQAFTSIWELEKQGYYSQFEFHYQDALAYALGRRGAFGALTGLDLSLPRRRLAMVFMALGYLQVNKRQPQLSSYIFLEKEYEQEVATMLEERFGLSGEESRDCIQHYGSDFNDRLDLD